MNQSNESLEMSLKQAEKRAHQHWYQDGLGEMVVGIYFFLLALLFYIEYFTQGANISAIGLPIITLGGVFAISPIVRRLKARFTYPRTGFVKHKEPSTRLRLLILVISLAVGGAIGTLVARQPWADFAIDSSQPEDAWLVWLPLAQAAVLAILFSFMAHRFGVVRYYVVAAVSVLAGVVIVAARLGDVLGTAVYLTVMFLALVTSGLATLRHYLRQTQPYREEV